MPSEYSIAALNAAADAMEASFGTAPTLRIRTGPRPVSSASARQGTILGSVVMAGNWLGDAVNGVKTAVAAEGVIAGMAEAVLEHAGDGFCLLFRGVPGELNPLAVARGGDLRAAGMNPGPDIGVTLRRLEDWWVASGFTPGKQDLLKRLT